MTQAEGPLSKTTILGLVAMALAVLVVANDFTALSVALLQWSRTSEPTSQLCSRVDKERLRTMRHHHRAHAS